MRFRGRDRHIVRPNVRRDLEDELRFHLETETEDLIAAGVPPDEARRRALARFGDVDRFLRDCAASDRRRLRRDRRGEWWSAVRQDVAHMLRGLLRRPGFALSATLVLALGVGANVAVLSIVDHIFVRPPAGVRAPEGVKRLYVERQRSDGSTYFQVRFSFPEARTIDSTIQAAGFPSTIFYRRRATAGEQGGAGRAIASAWVAPTYFSVLGVPLHAGTEFDVADGQPGAPSRTAIVSWAYWQRALGGDRTALGSTIWVDGIPVTIRGIAARGFSGIDIDATDVWLPIGGLTSLAPAAAVPWRDNWGIIAFRVLARVPDGVDARQLEPLIELAMRAAAIARAEATSTPVQGAVVRRAIAAPILASHGPERLDRGEAIAAALGGLQLLLLVIATANAGNLLLGRALDRQRETAVRLALGMGRARLVFELAIESLVIAVAATIAAVIAAAWMGSVLRSMVLPGTEFATGPVDGRLAALALATGLLAGLGAALVPLFATRRVDLVTMLKGTSREGGGRSRVRTALVGLQAALALVLLVGTGLIARSLYNLRTDDLGLDVSRGIIVHRSDSGGALPLREVARLAQSIPGVTGHALAAEAPLYDILGARHLFTNEGDTIRALESGSGYVAAEPPYLRVVGTRLVRGRDFTPDDGRGAAPVMIASEEFARRVWRGRDPLGECVRVERASGPCYTVIGIAQNARVFDLVEDPKPVFYVPLEQRPDREPGVEPPVNALVLRVSGDVLPVVARLRSLLADTASSARTGRVVAMGDVLAPRYEPWELAARLFAGFAVLALVLTVAGLQGVLSYLVTLRRRELSVRMALGADRRRVMAMILRTGVAQIAGGALVGAVGAMTAARLLRPLLYEVSPRDPLVMIVALVALGTCALLAALLPARQAMRVDPSLVLRED